MNSDMSWREPAEQAEVELVALRNNAERLIRLLRGAQELVACPATSDPLNVNARVWLAQLAQDDGR